MLDIMSLRTVEERRKGNQSNRVRSASSSVVRELNFSRSNASSNTNRGHANFYGSAR